MKTKKQNENGATLLSFAMASLIAATGFMKFSGDGIEAHRQTTLLHETVIAEAMATELIEFFRSYTNTQLQNYLLKLRLKQPYYLCAHINLLDRQSGKIFREDPLASLPPNGPLARIDSRFSPNRYYRVQIINLKTMKTRKEVCGEMVRNLSFDQSEGLKMRLSPEEKFMVTVGVTWVPRGGSLTEVRRVALSTVLYGN